MWLGQALAVLVAVAAGLLASRRVGLKLARTQKQLCAAVRDLSAREAFLGALLDTMDAEVVAVAPNGRTTLINQAARRSDGQVHGHAGACPPVWGARAGLLAADGVSALPYERLPLVRALAGEEVVLWPSRDAEKRMLVHARPVLLPDGTPAGALSSSNDITSLRRQEAESERRHRDLDAMAKATMAVLTGSDARAAVCQAAVESTDGLARYCSSPTLSVRT